MKTEEIAAYRKLLADAVLQMRGFSGVFYQNSGDSSQPALRHINALADLFHNLAIYSQDDFKGFDPDQFWRQFRHYQNRIPEMQDFETTFRKYAEDGTRET